MISHRVLDRRAARDAPVSAPRESVWWLMVITVLGIIAAAVYYHQPQPSQGAHAPPVSPSEIPLSPKAGVGPTVRHPIGEAQPDHGDAGSLPAYDKSDQVLQDLLSQFLVQDSLLRIFQTSGLVHRFVVTIDNLPRRHLPRQLSPVKPMGGEFLAGGPDANVFIAAENFSRYRSFVFAAEALDAEKAVAAYARYYPWFQQEYRALGYASGAFNDRLIEAIDDLLRTPEIDGPIRVTQSKVLYEFADADLEALSAGEKILLRMGPENAARIKARLRGIRRELTGTSISDPVR